MPVRIATLNLLHGIRRSDGAVDPLDLSVVMDALGADVLALQEVDRGQQRSHGADQTRLVAAGGAAPCWRFLATVHGTPGSRRDWVQAPHVDVGAHHEPGSAPGGRPSGGHPGTAAVDRRAPAMVDGEPAPVPEYGIGLVSRLPVLTWHSLRLGGAPFGVPLLVPAGRRVRPMYVADEPRGALAAVVALPGGGTVTVVSTHLSFVPGWNVHQVRRLRRWAATLPQPVVIAGDLNLPGRWAPRVSGWSALASEPTYPAPAPRIQLDHLLTGDPNLLRAVAAGSITFDISDHAALWADLDLR